MHYALVTSQYRVKLFLDRNSVLRYVVHQNQRCLAATLTCVSKTTKGFTHVLALTTAEEKFYTATVALF